VKKVLMIFTRIFIKISFLLVLVNFVFATDISCLFDELPIRCNLPPLPVIQVTTQNEPITVMGNTPNGFEFVEQVVIGIPHKLNFIPTKLFDSLRNLILFQEIL
jgi:hypothetical protein